MPTLRSQIIRLAYTRSELRPHLLRLVAYGGTHVEVSELPQQLKLILKRQFGYGRRDIEVIASDTIETGGPAFEGNRSRIILINLGTWQTKDLKGSWGGANPFEQDPERRLVDTQAKVPIPPNSAVIKGESGGRGTFARIYIHPSNMAPLLDNKEVVSLSEKEKYALGSFSLKGGQYRREHFSRYGLGDYGPTNQHVVSLAAKGLVKIMRSGPRITAKGRNEKDKLGYQYQG